MTVSAILTTVLGGGAGMTVVLGVYDRVRNRKFDRRKQDATIKLDDAQYQDITARAEQTSSSNLMAVGAFWQGQFGELTKRFEAEQEWRRRVTEKLREHRAWDQQVTVKMEECGMHIDPPPSLDPDEQL